MADKLVEGAVGVADIEPGLIAKVDVVSGVDDIDTTVRAVPRPSASSTTTAASSDSTMRAR